MLFAYFSSLEEERRRVEKIEGEEERDRQREPLRDRAEEERDKQEGNINKCVFV